MASAREPGPIGESMAIMLMVLGLLGSANSDVAYLGLIESLGWDDIYTHVLFQEHTRLNPGKLELLLFGTYYRQPYEEGWSSLEEAVVGGLDGPVLTSVRVQWRAYYHGISVVIWLLETPSGVKKHVLENGEVSSCFIAKDDYLKLWKELENLEIWGIETDAVFAFDCTYYYISAMKETKNHQAFVYCPLPESMISGDNSVSQTMKNVQPIASLVEKVACAAPKAAGAAEEPVSNPGGSKPSLETKPEK